MADLLNFKITDTEQIGRFIIEATIVDSESQQILADYTGENCIIYPDIINTLSSESLSSLKQIISNWILSQMETY